MAVWDLRGTSSPDCGIIGINNTAISVPHRPSDRDTESLLGFSNKSL